MLNYYSAGLDDTALCIKLLSATDQARFVGIWGG